MPLTGRIIFGIPLTLKIREIAGATVEDGDLDSNFDTLEGMGFTVGSQADPEELAGYCGVELGEVEPYLDMCLSDIPKPTKEQKKEVRKLIKKLPRRIRDVAGRPSNWIIWDECGD